MAHETGLGPLRDGARVAIIGGGPAGVAVALTLMRNAAQRQIGFDITIFEPKQFGMHYNQCIGVLSPPILEILREELGIELPEDMVQRTINGYVLHGGGETILLEEAGGHAQAVRRVDFDTYMLRRAENLGANVVRSRVTAIERTPAGVVLFSDSSQTVADVVFACFGLDATLSASLSRSGAYRPPRVIETLVTRYAAEPEVLERFANNVQAWMPALEGVEFAALTPKSEHVSLVLAGNRLRIASLEKFLEFPAVRQFLPDNFELGLVYKGQFPCSPARGFYDDRFISVGDAAGLIRPFKGKGINSAFITGIAAARTAVEHGISRQALGAYRRACAEILRDNLPGQIVRRAANFMSHHLGMGPVIRYARRNEKFRWALAMSVTGGAPYRAIMRRCLSPSVAFGLIGAYAAWPFRRRTT